MTRSATKSPKGHGGARPGAGRPRAVRDPTLLDEADLQLLASMPAPASIEDAAERYARLATDVLVKRLIAGGPEAARVAAACALLDRGWGRPAVEIGGDTSPMLPFAEVPERAPLTLAGEIRLEARRHTAAALDVLRRIAEFGRSASASVAAARALHDRAFGRVAAAALPEEGNPKALGKKELAAVATKLAATGRYAPGTPPKVHGTSPQGRSGEGNSK